MLDSRNTKRIYKKFQKKTKNQIYMWLEITCKSLDSNKVNSRRCNVNFYFRLRIESERYKNTRGPVIRCLRLWYKAEALLGHRECLEGDCFLKVEAKQLFTDGKKGQISSIRDTLGDKYNERGMHMTVSPRSAGNLSITRIMGFNINLGFFFFDNSYF